MTENNPAFYPVVNITLSHGDAAAYIKQQFEARHDIKCTVTIKERKPTVCIKALLDAAYEASKNTADPYDVSPKIRAIKALRRAAEDQGIYVGIADAKIVVEENIPGCR